MDHYAFFCVYWSSIWKRRRFFMKIVVVQAPKALRGILAALFKVR